MYRYQCDDCEVVMDKHNKYGLTDLCDDCEPQYHVGCDCGSKADEDGNRLYETIRISPNQTKTQRRPSNECMHRQ